MKLSLCIPTNGIVEWISQVIDSIYAQDVPAERFEVVIVDNGNNPLFLDYIKKKMNEHSNIRYKRIKCPIFMNEIEAYKMAEGDFIKFVNHRTVLLDGTLDKWISFMEENHDIKPVAYFANGELDKYYSEYIYESFDEFIGELGIYSSWSTGMSMWKEDLDDLRMDSVNELFPHTSILFKNRKSKKYIVDNRIYLREVKHTSAKKGNYDLFYAFGVEYPALLLDLYRNGDIKVETFLKVKEENLDFIIENYKEFCVEKTECSYDLSSYDDSINVFYSHKMVSDREKIKSNIFQNELQRRIDAASNQSDLKVVYGAGILGREFVMENGEENIVCFIDRSTYKQRKLILGIPVVSYEDFREMKINAEIVVCVKKDLFQKEEIEIRNAGMKCSFWGDN